MAENETVGGLGQFTQAQIQAFPEAHAQATRAVEESVAQGRAANSALLEFLNSQRGTGPSPLLQLATGLLRPTRTGGFGESLGAGVEGYTGALQQQRQAEMNRAMQIQQLQAATANLGMQAAQQRMALLNQGLQFPATAAAAQGSLADLDLLSAGTPGVPQTRTQLAVPGAAGMPAGASPVGPQPQITQTPLPPPPGTAGSEEGGGTAIPTSPNVEAALSRMRAAQGTPQPSAAPAPQAAAPAAAQAASMDPATGQAMRLLQDAAANPGRYAGPQGRALVERARVIVRESPEGQAAISAARARAEARVKDENAASDADQAFGRESATQQARTFAELASSGGEARQLMDRLQMFDQVSADLRSGIPGWFEQQAARIGVGPRATYIETAQALLKQLIPAQRQGMPGAVSDFDARNFELSLPRLIGTPEGRAMISNTLKSVAEYNIARAQVANAAANGEISRQDAVRRLGELPSPFTRFNRMEEERRAAQGERPAAGAPAGSGFSQDEINAELRRRGLIQ